MKRKISVSDVAKALGVSDTTIYAGLRLGKYPFGTAFKSREGNASYVYVLYPQKVREYIGDVGNV